MELLRRQYLQLIDPEQLQLPAKEILRLPEAQAKIFDDFFNDKFHSFLPPKRYKYRVLKKIVDTVEMSIVDPEEDEVSNDLASSLAQLLAQPLVPAGVAAQQKSHVTYTAPLFATNAPEVTLLEARSVLSASGTTGLRTWEAALLLGTYLFSSAGNNFVQNKNIIELGAGTGFLSIVCAKHLGARYVLATDGSGEVVNDLESNIFINRLEGTEVIDADILKWGHMLNDEMLMLKGADEKRSYDLVIGADVTYDGEAIPALVSTLRDLSDRFPMIKILISATVRNESTLNIFLHACDQSAFNIEVLDVELPPEDQQVGFFLPASTPVRVFLITRPR
ncbi:hypothetical protein MMC07_005154 [Pseudocyphellaria aurata]|nr:hypothetical protein [Pseudocyphellaria aurata]